MFRLVNQNSEKAFIYYDFIKQDDIDFKLE